MSYFVRGAWVEVGALITAEQVMPLLEHVVIPSLEMLAQWEEQGKIRGGVFAGERETVFVLEAASSDEVGHLLTSLPFWGMMKWDVKPLQSMRAAAERERASLLRGRGQG